MHIMVFWPNMHHIVSKILLRQCVDLQGLWSSILTSTNYRSDTLLAIILLSTSWPIGWCVDSPSLVMNLCVGESAFVHGLLYSGQGV